MGKTPLEICTQECKARCCRYINLRIDPPKHKIDQEEIRWFLCHEGVKVSFQEGRWWLQVETRCKQLTDDNLCAIYERRPAVCSDYRMESCDHLGEEDDHPEFTTPEQWEAWLAAKRERRNKRRRQRARQKRDKSAKPPTTRTQAKGRKKAPS